MSESKARLQEKVDELNVELNMTTASLDCICCAIARKISIEDAVSMRANDGQLSQHEGSIIVKFVLRILAGYMQEVKKERTSDVTPTITGGLGGGTGVWATITGGLGGAGKSKILTTNQSSIIL